MKWNDIALQHSEALLLAAAKRWRGCILGINLRYIGYELGDKCRLHLWFKPLNSGSKVVNIDADTPDSARLEAVRALVEAMRK